MHFIVKLYRKLFESCLDIYFWSEDNKKNCACFFFLAIKIAH